MKPGVISRGPFSQRLAMDVSTSTIQGEVIHGEVIHGEVIDVREEIEDFDPDAFPESAQPIPEPPVPLPTPTVDSVIKAKESN